jgi:hypothetical protein
MVTQIKCVERRRGNPAGSSGGDAPNAFRHEAVSDAVGRLGRGTSVPHERWHVDIVIVVTVGRRPIGVHRRAD